MIFEQTRCVVCDLPIEMIGFDDIDDNRPLVWTHGEEEDNRADHEARPSR